MKEHVIKSYEFDELSDEAKKKALEWGRDLTTDNDWITDEAEYFKTELLEPAGYEDAEIRCSGFYSQGDGASFEADATKAMLKLLPEGLKKYKDELTCAVTIRPGHYVHAHMMEISIPFPDEMTQEEEDMINALEVEVREDAVEQANKIFKGLMATYEELRSDENVADTIRANEYEFTADGERFTL